jgi:hypothetical protein
LGGESSDLTFFLLVGRWLLLLLGAKAAPSSQVTVTTATTRNARFIFRMELILLLAVRGLSMVVGDQFCEKKTLILIQHYVEENPENDPLGVLRSHSHFTVYRLLHLF